MGADLQRKAFMASLMTALLLAGPVVLHAATAEKRGLDVSNSVSFLDFRSYQIYGMEGGEIEIKIHSDIPVHVLVFEEDNRHTIQDALAPGGKGGFLFKKESVTEMNHTIKTPSSTNYYIIVQNYGSHYNRSAVIRLHADSIYDDKEALDLNWNYLYLLLVPLVLIPVVIWIRKRA